MLLLCKCYNKVVNKLIEVDGIKHNEWRILIVNDIMKNCNYSKDTTVEEQKVLQIKYSNLPDAPPRSEWMTVDECFDDIINSVERAYKNEEFDPSKWIPLDEAEERLVAAISKIYDEVHNEDQ